MSDDLYQGDFDAGYKVGYDTALFVDRVEAFAAIRRAAEVTREAERLHLCHYEANYIRRAIRAAIGSDKT